MVLREYTIISHGRRSKSNADKDSDRAFVITFNKSSYHKIRKAYIVIILLDLKFGFVWRFGLWMRCVDIYWFIY